MTAEHAEARPTTGRRLLGAISGLLFGLFVAIDLLLVGALSLDSTMLLLLPLLGAVGGTALAWWAPLRRH